METVGFIGLGNMGRPMAENVRKAGYPLVVYNRTRSKAEPLRAAGAEVVASPAEAARTAEIVITMAVFEELTGVSCRCRDGK